MDKRRIDRIRDSAGSISVGDDSDGVITSPIVVADKLFIVKERAIYQIRMADDIDPERTREDVPNTQQRVLGAGSESRVVQATILTAVELFKKEYIADGVDRDFVILTSISLCEELLHAELILADIERDMKAAEEKLQSPKDRAFSLPSIQDIKPRTKSFVQRIEHFLQMMFRISQTVLGEVKNKFFEGLSCLIKEKFKNDEQFNLFAQDLANFAKLIKNCRNAIEHPKQGNILVIEDYRLDKEMVAHRPALKLIHKDTPFDYEDLLQFTSHALHKSLFLFEDLLAFMARHHLKEKGQFTPHVFFVEEDQRRFGVKYSLGVEFSGSVVPVA